MQRRISLANAPALGDVRRMAAGDVIHVKADAHTRKDWPRYADAIATAVTRGASVHREF
jgi:hypothetical protein